MDSLTVTLRPLVLEDFGPGQFTVNQQVDLPVLELGVVPVSPLLSAASDGAAQTAGLALGDVYLKTSVFPVKLHVVGGSSGGGVAGAFSSAGNIGTILDGTVIPVSPTLSIAGAPIGGGVTVGTEPPLPSGVDATGKVTATNVVTVEVWNLSGGPVDLGQYLFNVWVLVP